MTAQLTERIHWLTGQPHDLRVTTMGRYTSRLIPVRFGKADAFGLFTASRKSGRLPVPVGPVQSWHFLDPELNRVLGVLEGSLARSFRDVPSFELAAQTGMSSDQMLQALGAFDASVESLAGSFFAAASPAQEDRAKVASLSTELFGSSEAGAMRAAFAEFYDWVEQ